MMGKHFSWYPKPSFLWNKAMRLKLWLLQAISADCIIHLLLGKANSKMVCVPYHFGLARLLCHDLAARCRPFFSRLDPHQEMVVFQWESYCSWSKFQCHFMCCFQFFYQYVFQYVGVPGKLSHFPFRYIGYVCMYVCMYIYTYPNYF